MLKKVDEFRESCLDGIKLQIELQKIYINVNHPDFNHYKQMIDGRKNLKSEKQVSDTAKKTSPFFQKI